MMKHFYRHNLFLTLTFVLACALWLSSCKTKSKLLYFQNNETSYSRIKSVNMNFKYKPNDIVSIKVSSGTEPLSVAPFNMDMSVTNYPDGYSGGNASREGYLIDQNGDINFPVIGKMRFGGLNRIQAIDLLTKKLKDYVNDPVIHIRVSNFKITVLGSVKEPGTFNIPNERITLLEAIGLAKDTKITGVRKNVLIIRERNNKKEEIRVDLTSKNTYSSPAFYLEQNDVVYVEPNLAERHSSTLFKSSTGILLSSITVFLTALNITLSK